MDFNAASKVDGLNTLLPDLVLVVCMFSEPEIGVVEGPSKV